MTDKEKIELLDEFLELIPNKPNNYDLGESIRSIFIKRIGYSKSRSYTNQTRIDFGDSKPEDVARLGED